MPLTKNKKEKHAVAALAKTYRPNSKISKKLKGPVASAVKQNDTYM